jgi:hypothetical protein
VPETKLTPLPDKVVTKNPKKGKFTKPGRTPIASQSEVPENRSKDDVAYIGSIKEIPDHRHDNDYILHGYRINFNTVGRILRSLFMIHNETVNVWSHLIGVLVFIGLIVYTVLWRGHPGQGSQMEVMRQRLMDAEMVRGLMH